MTENVLTASTITYNSKMNRNNNKYNYDNFDQPLTSRLVGGGNSSDNSLTLVVPKHVKLCETTRRARRSRKLDLFINQSTSFRNVESSMPYTIYS